MTNPLPDLMVGDVVTTDLMPDPMNKRGMKDRLYLSYEMKDEITRQFFSKHSMGHRLVDITRAGVVIWERVR